VLLETTQSDGSDASFIYRNGGTIDANAANDLCIKVRPLAWCFESSKSAEQLANTSSGETHFCIEAELFDCKHLVAHRWKTRN